MKIRWQKFMYEAEIKVRLKVDLTKYHVGQYGVTGKIVGSTSMDAFVKVYLMQFVH